MSAGGPQEPRSTPPHRWGALTKQIVVVSWIAAGVWAVFRFSSIIPPVLIAIILAYILTPIVNALRRWTRMPRALALVIVYILLLVAITMTPALILPNLVRQFTALNVDLVPVLDTVKRLLAYEINLFGLLTITPSDYVDQLVKQLQEQLPRTLPSLASPVASGAWGVLTSVTSSIVWLIFIFVVSFYLVKDSAEVGRYLRSLLPAESRDEWLRLLSEIRQVWNSFFRGQIILGLVIGVVVASVMSFLGVRNALMLGLVAGILEVIPNFGPTIAAIPGILLALVWGSATFPQLNNLIFAIIVAGCYIVIQQLENNLLVPRIIGRSVNLHPVVVLVGAVAGILLGGVLGVLLASPAIATLRILTRYVYRKVTDQEPFDEPAEAPRGLIAGRQVAALLFDLEDALLAPGFVGAGRWETLLRWVRPARVINRLRRLLRLAGVVLCEGAARVALYILRRAGLAQRAPVIEKSLHRWRQQRASLTIRTFGGGPPELIDGADGLLAYLNGKVKMALISRRSPMDAEDLLLQHGVAGYFEAFVTWSEVGEAEAAGAVSAAARALGLPVERCALVSGAPALLAGARAAGVLSVSLARRGLEPAGADMAIERLSELRNRF